MLITPHDNEDPGDVEGMEALRPMADYSDEERYEKLDEGNDEDPSDGDGPGDAGNESHGVQPSDDSSDASNSDDSNVTDNASLRGNDGSGVEDASMGESDAVCGGVQPSLAPQPSESPLDDKELKALQLLYDKAKLERNDTALKFYRQELRQVLRDQHEGVQPSSV